jgi:hypothetical protein
MVNKNGIRGTRWESAIVKYLKENGYEHAERRQKAGAKDKGDITGVNHYLMIEAKDEARINLAGYMDEVVEQTKNANALIGVAWIKRRNKGTERSYVVMEPKDFLTLLAAWKNQ